MYYSQGMADLRCLGLEGGGGGGDIGQVQAGLDNILHYSASLALRSSICQRWAGGHGGGGGGGGQR